jgi:hypothetical protein
MHDNSLKLEVIMGLDRLFGDSLYNALRIMSLELACEEITKSVFKKWHDTTYEEQPDAPIRSPEADTRTLTNGTDNMARQSAVFHVLGALCSTDVISQSGE